MWCLKPLSRLVGSDYHMPVVLAYERHAITKDLGTLMTLFPLVRSVQVAKDLPQGITAQGLAMTSAESWAETDLKALQEGRAALETESDRRGPITIAAVATIRASDTGTASSSGAEPRDQSASAPGARAARLVVFGDAEFANNSLFPVQGNGNLFLNTVSWLAEEEDLIAIRPRRGGGSGPVMLTAAQAPSDFLAAGGDVTPGGFRIRRGGFCTEEMATVSGKKTLLWAVVLLALGVFYYLYEIQGGQKRQEVASKRELLLQFAADDVTGLTIKREQETVRAEKRDGHWYLTEPLAVRGDDQKYRELTRYVAEQLRHTRVVEEQPSTLEPFGLTTPRLEIEVTLKDQSAPLILRLGGTNPTGGNYYAQVAGRPAVYLVSGMTKDVLDAPLYALRDKVVLAFTPAEVQEVHLARGTEEPVMLQRQEGDTWHLIAPVSAKADDQQVRALLQRLRDVKVQAFIAEDATDLESYGLQTPALHVSLGLGPPHAPLTLMLGNVDTERKGVYAKRGDAAHVFLLAQDFWDNLPRTATALRDKTLWQFEREHITRLEIQSPYEHMVLTNTGPRQFLMEQPLSSAGDGDAIFSLLWDLRELKAKEFVAETPDALDLYGLDAPRWRVTLWEKAPAAQEAVQHDMAFGAEAPDRQGVYVRVGEGPTIYLVGHTEAQRIIEKTAFDLRNKKLLAFTTDTVQKLRVQYPTSQLTVERSGKGWKLTEPQKQDIPQRWKIDHVLYELSLLEYTDIVTDIVDDGSRYGLDTPQVQITLWQQDGTSLGSLIVGKMAQSTIAGTGTVYAQLGARPPLYALKSDFLNSLPKTTAELTAEK